MHFEPFPLLSGPHQQTIMGWFSPVSRPLASVTETVLLPDNDRIACEVSTPEQWQDGKQIIILIHGLCGSHESPFIVRAGRRLYDAGCKVVRMNMRGCGSGAGLARKIFHGGRSDDIIPVLKQLRGQTPNSPITLVGYSLGGNQVLKLAGEQRRIASDLLSHVIAICPCTDLLASARMIHLRQNQIYERHFLGCLFEGLKAREGFFPDLPKVELPNSISLFEFDQLYTVPQCGFKSAIDYYSQASAARFVPDIRVPTSVLFAADDPVVDWTALNGLSLPNTVEIRLTRKGGHLGFIGHPTRPGGYRWMDSTVVKWAINGPHKPL